MQLYSTRKCRWFHEFDRVGMTDKNILGEIDKLISDGNRILYAGIYAEEPDEMDKLSKDKKKFLKEVSDSVGDFKKAYQAWYSKGFRIVRLFIPERLEEFELLYKGQKNIKNLNHLNAGITHYLQGFYSSGPGFVEKRYFSTFQTGVEGQINIINSIKENFNDVLFNIESELSYSVFNSEIHSAKELKKHKHLRAAGAVVGVVIEKHLKMVCSKRNLKMRKSNPSISDYNDLLKSDKVIDMATWRLLQRSADIRNYCVHSKERDPKPDEIDDIIRSAEKIISEIH